ncbi:MAG: hypothetical protein JW703_01020 [Candidatus Diapherotrites archaeon]|nr:hypothetical protein [Candidatus Diapherotrites archaeon]
MVRNRGKGPVAGIPYKLKNTIKWHLELPEGKKRIESILKFNSTRREINDRIKQLTEIKSALIQAHGLEKINLLFRDLRAARMQLFKASKTKRTNNPQNKPYPLGHVTRDGSRIISRKPGHGHF